MSEMIYIPVSTSKNILRKLLKKYKIIKVLYSIRYNYTINKIRLRLLKNIFLY